MPISYDALDAQFTNVVDAVFAAQDAVEAAGRYRALPEASARHRQVAVAQIDIALISLQPCRVALTQPPAPDQPAAPAEPVPKEPAAPAPAWRGPPRRRKPGQATTPATGARKATRAATP
jgi:hypothetical protein